MAIFAIMKSMGVIVYFKGSGSGPVETYYRIIEDLSVRATDGGNRRIYASAAYTPSLTFSDARNSMYLGAA